MITNALTLFILASTTLAILFTFFTNNKLPHGITPISILLALFLFPMLLLSPSIFAIGYFFVEDVSTYIISDFKTSLLALIFQAPSLKTVAYFIVSMDLVALTWLWLISVECRRIKPIKP